MRRLIAIATLVLALAGASAQAQPAPAGPAWWTISNGGGSTLYIMAIPDGLLNSLEWDSGELKRRIAGARLLVTPLVGPAQNLSNRPNGPAEDYALDTRPGSAGNQNPPISGLWLAGPGRVIPVGRFDVSPALADPIDQHLSPDLNRRFQQALGPVLGNLRTAMTHAKVWEAALWLDLWNWPRGRLGNQVTEKAMDMAGARMLLSVRKIAVEQVYVPALWKPILPDGARAPEPPNVTMTPDRQIIFDPLPNNRIPPPETVQLRCLLQVIEQTESGQMPAARQAAMQAWARGDVGNALKRSNDIQYCLMGDQASTDAQSYLKRSAYTYIQSLDLAFDEPGDSVALVEFDPLLLQSGGVLDYYRRLGYDITEPAGAR